MFRLFKIAHFTKPLLNQELQVYGPKTVNFGITSRWYTKKDDDCCKKEPTCKPPKPVSPECKPDSHLHPCGPKPVECGQGKKPLPLYHDCATPNRMDTLPKLQCSHGGNDGDHQKNKYLRALIVGAIALLITLGCLYMVQTPNVDIKEKKKSLKKVRKKMPEKSKDIPNDIPYLIIGGGTASFSAFRAIKSTNPEARVLIISEESDFPYMRPPLSKELWCSTDTAVKSLVFKQWNGMERSLFYEPDDFFMSCKDMMKNQEKPGVAVAKGWVVTKIDVEGKKVILEDNYEINYGKCLIATGSKPKNLKMFEDASEVIQEKITTFREIFDFQKLHETCDEIQKVVVIGGGFLGSELACALARKGRNKFSVLQIFREGGCMGHVLPEYLSYWATEKVKKEGVTIIPFVEVTGVSLDENERVVLNLSNEQTISADHVVVAIGAAPNTDLAENSDLEVDPDLGGYLVNTELQARSHLYIAGDCSCFYDTKFGRRRVEHHDHAVVSGRLAGENMTGASKPYWHQSMFWSDLGPEVGYEAIGIVDSELPTVGVFTKASAEDALVSTYTEGQPHSGGDAVPPVPPECEKFIKADPEQRKLLEDVRKSERNLGPGEDFGKGVIFYLRDDTVVGIVLWNVFNKMHVARQVLKDERKYDDLNEVAKLFEIHENAPPEPKTEEEEEEKDS